MSYFESRLQLNFNDFDEIQEKLWFCTELGIKNIILEPKNKILKIEDSVKKKIKSLTSSNIYYRISLTPSDLNQLKKKLKSLKKNPVILSVESNDKEILTFAAKDSRIDLISFTANNISKSTLAGIISLTKQNNSFIELSLTPIMEKNRALQSKNFRKLYRFIQVILKLKANYVFSGNTKESFMLRNPRALASICHTILGIPLEKAKKGFTSNVEALLDRTNLRQKPNIYQKGVEFVKGGNNT